MARCTLTQNDNGRTFSLNVKDQLVINLGENASTGYLWEVYEYDRAVLSVTDAPSEVAKGAAVGAGGVHSFLVTALAPGTSAVGIKLWRGFEPENQVKKFQLTVQVQKGS